MAMMLVAYLWVAMGRAKLLQSGLSAVSFGTLHRDSGILLTSLNQNFQCVNVHLGAVV